MEGFILAAFGITAYWVFKSCKRRGSRNRYGAAKARFRNHRRGRP
jgi:hypothetical protein